MSQDIVQQVKEYDLGGDDYDYDEDEDSDSPMFCTFAVTGTNPSFQAIFVCLDCAAAASSDKEEEEDDDDDNNVVCLCRACADACHFGHDVDFIGMGPSYCDCCQLLGKNGSCRLQSTSQAEAARLGIDRHHHVHHHHVLEDPPQEAGKYLQEVFTISSLQEDHVLCDRLIREAVELIQHSRDTHWLDYVTSSLKKKKKCCCKLEDLALSILHRHVDEYLGKNFHGGAEWWVQVKQPVSFALPRSHLVDNHDDEAEAAIDLHYDKDENLAESFGLGSFPLLSTVTYLSLTTTTASHSSNASPTLVFPHTYDTDEGEVMQDMLVSYPRRGKHLVFDGRLLHGAPAHPALLLRQKSTTAETVSEGSSSSGSVIEQPRVTFLVNIWPNGPPSGVKRLPADVCQRVLQAGKRNHEKGGLHKTTFSKTKPVVEFQSREIHCVTLETVEDLAEEALFQDRIELPFVSRGATWIGRMQQGTPDLVVVTFPPPPTTKSDDDDDEEEDTIKVRFGPGLQAYLEYKVVRDEKMTEQGPNDGDFYLQDYV